MIITVVTQIDGSSADFDENGSLKFIVEGVSHDNFNCPSSSDRSGSQGNVEGISILKPSSRKGLIGICKRWDSSVDWNVKFPKSTNYLVIGGV